MKPVILGCMLIVACASAGAAEVKRPVGPMKNCTEGECHAAQKNHKVLHGPTAISACDVCHTADDERKHTFKLKEKDKALCNFCHVDKVVARHMHKPVTDGQCLSCHDPHGAGNRTLLRSDNMAELCESCHKDVTQARRHVHGPVASGSCAACHNGHGSDAPKLLAAQGRDMCTGCHDRMADQLKTVKHVHKPMEGDCRQCHEVHASNHAMQLKQEPLDLCASCHQDVMKLASEAGYKHTPVTTGQTCLGCHTPHGSDMDKLVKINLAAVCLECHDKPVQDGRRRSIPAVAEIGRKGMFLHGPIRENNCSGCHAPHGGNVSRLLSKPYPETFYEAFDPEKYALCFTCHDRQLVLLEKTEGLTRFRDGQRNLHFAHVQGEKGRSCRACHSTHASTFPVHVRETVPFGKWELPIKYTQSRTGGSCAPGCHQEYAYDRDKAVNPPGTKLAGTTTRPAAR